MPFLWEFLGSLGPEDWSSPRCGYTPQAVQAVLAVILIPEVAVDDWDSDTTGLKISH